MTYRITWKHLPTNGIYTEYVNLKKLTYLLEFLEDNYEDCELINVTPTGD